MELITYYSCTDCIGQPIVTNDTLIVNSNSGVKIFVKETGKLIYTLDSYGMIALSEQKLYVTNNEDGTVQMYLLRLSLSDSTKTEKKGNVGVTVAIVIVCVVILLVIVCCIWKCRIKNDIVSNGKPFSVVNKDTKETKQTKGTTTSVEAKSGIMHENGDEYDAALQVEGHGLAKQESFAEDDIDKHTYNYV
eukprot:204755_1